MKLWYMVPITGITSLLAANNQTNEWALVKLSVVLFNKAVCSFLNIPHG